jgi:hypothetical protein
MGSIQINIHLPPSSSSESKRKSKGTKNISGNEVEDGTLCGGSQCSTCVCPFFCGDLVAVFGFGQVDRRVDFCTMLLSTRGIAGSHA